MTDALVIGAGPAGLMAAEALAAAGRSVLICEAKPSPARKFLMAGKSGLNLTKDEPRATFLSRYDAEWLRPMLEAFGPDEAMGWARGLGQEIFTGSSGRVFPVAMKASPLLRAWLARLAAVGVELRTRWRWAGFDGGAFAFETPAGRALLDPAVSVLALGGASWPRLGSDAAWVPWLAGKGVAITTFRSANMGLSVAWSDRMARHFGVPVKGAALVAGGRRERGEFVVSARGIEGGGVYAVSRAVREGAALTLDLAPDRSLAEVAGRLAGGPGKGSLPNWLRKALKLDPVRLALLQEWGRPLPRDERLARLIKALPVRHDGPRPLAEAISSAGGVARESLTGDLELLTLPGVFAAGEMLDWEAPTGGYLLTACLATGRWAGRAAAASPVAWPDVTIVNYLAYTQDCKFAETPLASRRSSRSRTAMPNPAETRAPLRIDAAELRLVRLPLVTPFTIATGTMTEKTFPLLTLGADGIEGHAEGVMDPLPDYLEETTAGAMDFLRNVLLPQVVGRSFAHPQALARALLPWRANHMARATVEMAFWDLWARSLDLPLQTVLGGQGEAVDVGVSLGIGPVAETLDRVAEHLDQGYRRIKLKVKPGHDVGLLQAVRREFPDTHLTVDANCCYTLADTPILQRMDAFDLDYIEQPLAWDDIHDHAMLQARLRTPICLDECIRTVEHARKALQADAARVINIKVGRSGGYASALRIHDLCEAFAVPVWCGGMLESGIGRAHNIHLSTLPNFTKPGDTSSASRYFTRDIIEQRLETRDGRMAVPAGPGTGVTLDLDYLRSATLSHESLRA